MKKLKKLLSRFSLSPKQEKQNEPERKKRSLIGEFSSEFKKRLLGALSMFLIALIGSGLTFLFIIFGGYEYIQKLGWIEQSIKESREVCFKGQLVRLDESYEVPMANTTVVLKGVDNSSGQTNDEGYFEVTARVPLDSTYVYLRFVDDQNRSIHTCKAAVPLNQLEEKRPVRYVVSDEPLLIAL